MVSLEQALRKKHYGFYKNAAVQICSWTKKAIREQGVCYKQKFYGVPSHRCMQFTPIVFCQNSCIYCWRPQELVKPKQFISLIKASKRTNYEAIFKQLNLAEPEEMVEALLKERKKLLIGYLGYNKLNRKLFDEAIAPVHYAISLVGEPLLYAKLCELVQLLKTKYKAKSIFIVSNGLEPEAMLKLKQHKCLPTQFYLSLTACNKTLFNKVNRSVYVDGWQRLLKSLDILASLNCRTVIRLTLIAGINDKPHHIKQFAKLIKKANPDFVEVKAYMFLGYSMKRLSKHNMPSHEQVKTFALKLLKYLDGFKFEDEHPASRIVLLKNKQSKYSNIIDAYKK